MTTSPVSQRGISRLRSLTQTRFCEILVRENALDKRGFEQWVFLGGMLFGSWDKWWGDRGKRVNPHEGVDFCFYRDRAGRLRRLSETAQIPVIYDGMVAGIVEDFLGKTIIVTHASYPGNPRALVSLYGHTRPNKNIEVGAAVTEGQRIATLTPADRSTAGTGPHLHLSLGWAGNGVPWETFDWRTAGTSNRLRLVDPMQVVDCRYVALEAAGREGSVQCETGLLG